MVATYGRGGVVPRTGGQGFAPPTHQAIGNNLPPDTGLWPSTGYSEEDRPGPAPAYPGYVIGGTAGAGNDGAWGSDPRATPAGPPFVWAWGEGDPGGATGGPLGYAEGLPPDPDTFGRTGNAGQLGLSQDPLPTGRPSWWRGALQGFNDKLTVKDRHAYWDTGTQRQGTDFTSAGSPPNSYNNPLGQPPMANLRTVNRTISYQLGTDKTRNQDDLSRPYTWLGEQGSGWASIYGGVPGLYQPYGTRGGVPYPIVDPSEGKGGQTDVFAGPPHGLHSLTYPDGGDTLNRYMNTPQMRPVRVDRPSNSPIAGQAYSQTVQFQGTTAGAAQPGGAAQVPGLGRMGTRAWGGRRA